MYSSFSPSLDLTTVLSIAFFKSHQSNPDTNEVTIDWLRFPKSSSLPNIYHHIRVGTELEIRRESNNPFISNIQFFFKNHFIGELNGNNSSVVADLLLKGIKLKTTVSKVEKEKFIPTQNIQVKIQKV